MANAISMAGTFPPIPTPFDAAEELELKALAGNLAKWNAYPLGGYVVLLISPSYSKSKRDDPALNDHSTRPTGSRRSKDRGRRLAAGDFPPSPRAPLTCAPRGRSQTPST